MPLVTAVVPAYNVSCFVEEAIESICRQTHGNIELIAVDDGSTDDTGQLLDRMRQSHGHRVHDFLVLHQDNRGPSAARNTALRIARGEYIAFLDADDRWHPGLLKRHLEILKFNNRIDLTICARRIIGETGIDTGLDTGFRSRVHPFKIGFEELIRDCGIGATSVVAARRGALAEAGYFDEDLTACVDLDLWLRVAALRADNIEYIPEILADYRYREGQITGDWRRLRENWDKVIDKARQTHPELVASVEAEGRARLSFWNATIAYRAGEYSIACRLLRQSWRGPLKNLATDPRFWRVSVQYNLLNLLPDSLHDGILVAARQFRTRVSAANRV